MSDHFRMFENIDQPWRPREDVLEEAGIPVDIEDAAWASSPRRYPVNGEVREFFSIGDLAKAINREPVTIRLWERQGRLPRATWRTPTPQDEQVPGRPVRGQRLWTRDQVERIQQAQRRHLVRGDWNSFTEELSNGWAAE